MTTLPSVSSSALNDTDGSVLSECDNRWKSNHTAKDFYVQAYKKICFLNHLNIEGHRGMKLVLVPSVHLQRCLSPLSCGGNYFLTN